MKKVYFGENLLSSNSIQVVIDITVSFMAKKATFERKAMFYTRMDQTEK